MGFSAAVLALLVVGCANAATIDYHVVVHFAPPPPSPPPPAYCCNNDCAHASDGWCAD